MVNFIGFLIIICGFFAPFLLSEGKIPSIFFFWIGFLLLLWSNKYFRKAVWPKWARIGLILNILGMSFLFLLTELVLNTPLSSSHFAFILLTIANWIFNPISNVFEFLYPYKQTIMPDGSIRFSISFLRGTVTSFFNVLVYIGIGIIFGRFISKRLSKVK